MARPGARKSPAEFVILMDSVTGAVQVHGDVSVSHRLQDGHTGMRAASVTEQHDDSLQVH